MNIVLVGYRCSGKSSVGRILAKSLRRLFLDTDTLIEKISGMPVHRLVRMHGWSFFRKMEIALIRSISQGDNLVIATGGGVVTMAENVNRLKKNGILVWLDAPPEALAERLGPDRRSARLRPSLTGGDPREEIRTVLDLRKPLYHKAADLVVDTTRMTIRDVAKTIEDLIKRKAGE